VILGAKTGVCLMACDPNASKITANTSVSDGIVSGTA